MSAMVMEDALNSIIAPACRITKEVPAQNTTVSAYLMKVFPCAVQEECVLLTISVSALHQIPLEKIVKNVILDGMGSFVKFLPTSPQL